MLLPEFADTGSAERSLLQDWSRVIHANEHAERREWGGDAGQCRAPCPAIALPGGTLALRCVPLI